MYICIDVYMYRWCGFVGWSPTEVGKPAIFVGFFSRGTPKPQIVPLKDPNQTPWAFCYTSRFVPTTASVRTPVFAPSRPWANSLANVPCTAVDQGDHPRTQVDKFTLVSFSFGWAPSWLLPSFSAASGNETHFAAILRCELFWWVCCSSKILNRPSRSTVLRKEASIGFVKQSANIIAVEIHLHCECPSACCLISITSTVVLHSSQLGVASLVTRS